MSMEKLLRIDDRDDVAVALCPLSQGEQLRLGDRELTLRQNVPMGHKVALRPIGQGQAVIKYGQPIGTATADILPGEHVHTHNLKTRLGQQLIYAYQPSLPASETVDGVTFPGFPRFDGRVGVRNEVWVLPTVGCVSSVATELARRADALKHGAVDGVHAFPHPYGCSQMGDDQEHTRQILADLATHPNAGGVLVLGLGCENSGVDTIRAKMGDFDEKRVRFLVCQEVEDELESGMAILRELIDQAASDVRVPCPASRLVVGLKCGGSDGLSGITANPVIGGFSDLLVQRGGTAILTEVPEMFGAETLLMARCKDEETFRKTVSLINDFKQYFSDHHQTIYENPSPGNKAGGISTLEDKALGCTQKSGTSPVTDVLRYGETARAKGLNLLSAPGNDLVASSALAAAGAQIVLFSTGRGTPFASPVPTVKIASNEPMAQKKSRWIDFDAGALLSGRTIGQLSEALFAQVLSVAGGARVKSEESGYHDMAIFKQGVTL